MAGCVDTRLDIFPVGLETRRKLTAKAAALVSLFSLEVDTPTNPQHSPPPFRVLRGTLLLQPRPTQTQP